MIRSRPIQIILIGFLLVVIGWVIPFLMIMSVIEPTFFLSFLSYACSFTGLMMGLIGAAIYTNENRRKK